MSAASLILLLVVMTIGAGLVGWWWGRRSMAASVHGQSRRLAADVDRARADQLARLPAADRSERRATDPALAPLVDAVDALVDDLARQRRRLGGAFAELREGMVILDRAGVIQFANPAAVAALGSAVEPGVALSHVSRQPEVLDAVRGARADAGWVSGRVYEAADGHLLEPQAGALEDDRVALVLRDVTLEKQVETMRREFVANVSHELKTPLTAIRGYAETLESSLDDPALGRFVGRILVQCRRLEALLADVMELARLEGEEMMRRTEQLDLDLRQLVDEAIEQVRDANPGMQTQVEVEAPTVVAFRGYREFLVQLLRNLLDNAVKYSPDGSRVDVQVIDGDDGVLIAVEDDGPGIASEHLPHLFERFYRIDSDRARSTGGTGLGLAIVKHAARAHGGEVRVESRLGHGTRFEVRLPRGA